MDSLPPYFNTGIFNTSAFYSSKDYLTKEEADKLYLSVGSGQNVYLTGITPGLVLGEKCVVPDINKDISGFLNLTAESSINVNRVTNGECFIASNGTVRTAIHCLTNSVHIGTTTNHNFNIQTNGSNVVRCLSTGSVDIPAHNGATLGLQLNGSLVTSTATELNYLSGLTLGTAQASKALVLDANRDITNIRRATFAGSGDIITLYNPQLTSRSTIKFDGDSTSKWELGSRNSNLAPVSTFYLYDNVASAYRLIVDSSGNFNIVNHNGSTTGLKLNDVLITATANELNYNDITTIGTAEASKALVLDASRNIININALTATNLTGTLQTASQPNITSIGTLTSLSTNSLTLNGTAITATAAEINYLDITTPGTAQASKALVLDSSGNITNINSINSTYINCDSINGTTTSGKVASYKFDSGDVINSEGMISVRGSRTMFSKAWTNDDQIMYIENSGVTNRIEASISISKDQSTTSTNAFRIGTFTNNDFVLFTNSTERLRINAAGSINVDASLWAKTRLHIGDTTDTSRMLSILDSTMGTNSLRYLTLGKSPSAGNQAELAFSYVSSDSLYNALTFGLYGGEKMRMSNNGCLSINTTDIQYSGYGSRQIIYANGAAEWGSVYKNTNSGTQKILVFLSNTSMEKGSIQFGSGSTSFNTSSDYRLKKDITPLNGGLELVNKLNPVNFKWKDSEQPAQGFIAHELQEHIPYCVSGKKNDVYDDNSINPQAVDYGKLTTVLVSAIKELTTRLKYLEDFISELDIEEV